MVILSSMLRDAFFSSTLDRSFLLTVRLCSGFVNLASSLISDKLKYTHGRRYVTGLSFSYQFINNKLWHVDLNSITFHFLPLL